MALREVNDSRLRVYEQLEVSIQELEITNQRLLDRIGTGQKTNPQVRRVVTCQNVHVPNPERDSGGVVAVAYLICISWLLV